MSGDMYLKFPKYRAVTKIDDKLYEGWPVYSTAGNTYLIIMMDDDDKDYPRIGYVEIYPETLEVIDHVRTNIMV